MKEITLKDDQVFIFLTYSPRAITLQKKFGNLPIKYIRAHVENESEMKLFERAVKLYHFDLSEEEAMTLQNQAPAILPGPSSGSNDSGVGFSMLLEAAATTADDDDMDN